MSNEMKDWLNDEQKEKNYELCNKYPFIKPEDKSYDYSYTVLDNVPKGWYQAAIDFCEALIPVLNKYNLLNTFKVTEMKVGPYKEFLIFCDGFTEDSQEEIGNLIHKCWEDTKHACANCGKIQSSFIDGNLCDECKNEE